MCPGTGLWPVAAKLDPDHEPVEVHAEKLSRLSSLPRYLLIAAGSLSKLITAAQKARADGVDLDRFQTRAALKQS